MKSISKERKMLNPHNLKKNYVIKKKSWNSWDNLETSTVIWRAINLRVLVQSRGGTCILHISAGSNSTPQELIALEAIVAVSLFYTEV